MPLSHRFKSGFPDVPAHETLRIGMLMALAGGFLDAYTYLTHEGVFAFAQTGNLVLLGLHAATGQWGQVVHYLLPVLVFFCGILFSEWLKHRLECVPAVRWEQIVLAIEAVLLLIVGLFSASLLPFFSLCLINFACSMQMHAFRRVRGVAYVSTMCTGNLRSAAELLYQAVYKHKPQAGRQALCLLLILAVFVGGTILGGFATRWLGSFSVLLTLPLFAVPFWILGRKSLPSD